MEAIKLEGNVMWAEFKHADLWHWFFYILKLIQRRVERENKGKEKRNRPRH